MYIENVNRTFEKLSQSDKAYVGAWGIWQEGVRARIFSPEFHGREHVNMKVLKENLRSRNEYLIESLRNQSNLSIGATGYRTINYTAAYSFWKFEENYDLEEIIKDGLDRFQQVFGFRAHHFNVPGSREHPFLHGVLKRKGVIYLDDMLVKNEHQGEGTFKRSLNFTGEVFKGLIKQVRNVVFEPTEKRGIDWVNYSMKQVEAAFRMRKPAIISSHRVNFSGNIDPNNRKQGLDSLRGLLKRIAKKYPEVEFISSRKLGEIISEKK